MQVHRPDPRHARLAERQEQVGDVAVAGEVPSIGERVLGDEDRLLHAAGGQRLHLAHHVGEGPAAVASPELGDRAERAAHVASLGDLHVRVRHLRGQQPWRACVVEIAGRRRRRPIVAVGGLADELDDRRQVRRAEDAVDLRHLAHDLRAVALGQAAGHDEGAAAPLLLEPRQLEDRLHRLLARAVDERAGVDDQTLGVLGLLDERKARLAQEAEHQLGVDLILRTAQGREVDLHGRQRSIPRGADDALSRGSS